MAATAGDEDAARVVDPDLLDLRVVEQRLERAEPADPGDELADHRGHVGHRRHLAGEAALVVGTDHALGDAAYDGGVALRVDALAAHGGPDVLVELVDQLRVSGQRHAGTFPRVRGCVAVKPR